jgi:hypothetical protein
MSMLLSVASGITVIVSATQNILITSSIRTAKQPSSIPRLVTRGLLSSTLALIPLGRPLLGMISLFVSRNLILTGRLADKL